MSKIKDIYTRKRTWKFWLLVFAIIIGISSLFVTNSLVDCLAYEEKKKIEIWAYATNQMVNISDDGNFSLAIKVMESNENIPIILADENDIGTKKTKASETEKVEVRLHDGKAVSKTVAPSAEIPDNEYAKIITSHWDNVIKNNI